MLYYEIRTCKFKESLQQEFTRHLYYDESEYQLCTMDKDTRIATDVITKEQFYVLKKDNYYRILASEAPKIEMNKKYGVEIKQRISSSDLKTRLKYYVAFKKAKELMNENVEAENQKVKRYV